MNESTKREAEDDSKESEVKKPRLSEESEDKITSTLDSNGTSQKETDVKSESQTLDKPALEKVRRKKVVLLLSYSGAGYLGMQRNPGAKTIEGDLLEAMRKSGVISEEYFEKPQLMLFQRAARTDKGVSAVQQVVSMKLPETATIEAINQYLPDQIRVHGMKRTTKGFNSKSNCDARTYSYVMPTYAFTPVGEPIDESFRMTPELVEKVNKTLSVFVGTRNFHNFTLKKNSTDPSANRYIIFFNCGTPFLRDGVEFVTLTVKGQSFMQHHIRKMVGLAIAVVCGHTTEETIHRAFKKDPLDIPKAPGLGLILEKVHYERYNKKFGQDGIHDILDWSDQESIINVFKENFILSNIYKEEKESKPMRSWLATLPEHSYSLRENGPPQLPIKE